MKVILISMSFLVSFYSFGSVEELQVLDQKISEIASIEVREVNQAKEKKRILSSMIRARKGYSEWKKENENHKAIRNEFKRVLSKIRTKESPEHFSFKKALDECKEKPSTCLSTLRSNLESIYTNSDIPMLTKRGGFSIVSTAYASGANVSTCDSGFGDQWIGDTSKLYLGIFGTNPTCGLTFYGAGIGYIDMSTNVQICVGSAREESVGVFADASALLLGVGTGLTVGRGGVCQIFTINAVGIGGFAGVVYVDGKKFR